MAEALWLADLEASDPDGGRGARTERRFRCPICQAKERALCLNMETGLWNCKRGECKASGKLADFWQERPKLNRRDFARQQLRRVCELPSQAGTVPPVELAFDSQPLSGTRGASYLCGRGVSVEVATLAGARFTVDFFGRAAITFPLHDQNGVPVAAQGRYIDGRDNPKTRTTGPKKDALFVASTLDGFGPFDAKERFTPLIITEAPLDALSLAEAGFPAVALCGTTGPQWLKIKAVFRSCFLAFDADDAGDRAAEELTPTLESFGAICHRLRPEGAKDWNEFLTFFGRDSLTDFLAGEILTK